LEFEVRHRFGPIGLSEFLELYFSDAVAQAAAQASRLESTRILDHVSDDAGGFSRRVQINPRGVVAAAVARLFGQRTLVLVEKSTFDAATPALDFEVEGPWGRAIHLAGRVTFPEDGDFVFRVLRARVEGRVPGFSRTLERALRKRLKKTYAENARILEAAVAAAGR
jgi:hypothetical protein